MARFATRAAFRQIEFAHHFIETLSWNKKRPGTKPGQSNREVESSGSAAVFEFSINRRRIKNKRPSAQIMQNRYAHDA
jgi:hypothetical protein